MITRKSMNRRSLLKAAGSFAGIVAVGTGTALGAAEGQGRAAGKPNIRFRNADFYGPDGTFDVEKGKDAIFALMRYHGYPIFSGLREGLWVSDYGLGHFDEVGLAAYIFMNEEKGNYLQLDIYLLPDQMLTEHYHLKTDKAEALKADAGL